MGQEGEGCVHESNPAVAVPLHGFSMNLVTTEDDEPDQ